MNKYLNKASPIYQFKDSLNLKKLTLISRKVYTNFPSGLKETEMTASMCPSIELEHLVTDRTLIRIKIIV